MEKDRIEAYARLRLERAREDLETAHLNIHSAAAESLGARIQRFLDHLAPTDH